MSELKTERLARCYANLQKWGEVDSPDLEWLLDEINKDRALLRSLLHGRAEGAEPRIRDRLGITANGVELPIQE